MSKGKPHLSWGVGKSAENSVGGKQASKQPTKLTY